MARNPLGEVSPSDQTANRWLVRSEPTPADVDSIHSLYMAAGWWREDAHDRFGRMVENSVVLFVCDPEAEMKVIGVLRALTDGVFTTWVPEVLVDPQYRRQGIARALVTDLRERFPETMLYADVLSEALPLVEEVGLVPRPAFRVYTT